MEHQVSASLEVDFGGKILWPVAKIVLPTQWQMLKKGLRAWMGVWGAAALCLPVPIIHLVFPPIGLIAGPFLGLLVYLRSKKMIERIDAELSCPRCSQQLELHLTAVSLPSFDACPHCKAGYGIYSWKQEPAETLLASPLQP